MMRIGIDLGGTKIAAVALDENGRELARERAPTPAGDYHATVAAVVGLVRAIEGRVGQRGSVGVGTPGALSPATGRIKNANSTALIGHAFDRDLAEALGREVRVANDANCFAVSEATDGAGADREVVFGVILGTGVGGGVVVRGRLLRGRNAVAGEWGHNPLPWPRDEERPGPLCYCGQSGCIEAFLSGPGLAADHRVVTGENLTPAVIVARAADDAAAGRSLARYLDRLARALATVINLLDPDAIVLGGGLSNMSMLYRTVPTLWGPYVFSDRVDTELLPARFGDASGVRGAAWLWPPA